jgi:hypothetical protein
LIDKSHFLLVSGFYFLRWLGFFALSPEAIAFLILSIAWRFVSLGLELEEMRSLAFPLCPSLKLSKILKA